MDYSKLGLDTDLVDAVKAITEASCSSKKMEKEELHPNQKQLDKNKNGKLDSDDFKKLRKEEEEVVEEEQIDELSKATLSSYVKKADKQANKASNSYAAAAARRHDFASDTPAMAKNAKKFEKRDAGADLARAKLNKEQVEEIEALAAKHGLTEE